MEICSTPDIDFNPDLAAATLQVFCRRCHRLVDHSSAVVLRPVYLVSLRVECHGRLYKNDLAELFYNERLRAVIDFDAGLRIADNNGVVHAAYLQVELPRQRYSMVGSACGTASGGVSNDRLVTCLPCRRVGRLGAGRRNR